MTGPLDDRAFRGALGRYGSGVTVMTTVADGEDHAITVSAFTSVSLDPPLVLVCVDKGVRMHAAVLDCGYWASSVLAGDQQPIADRFARSGRDLYSQFDGIGTTAGPKTGCPIVQGALSWIECRTWATYDGGDHTIVVGEVLSLGLGEPADPSALIYYSSNYRELPDS